LISCLSQQAFEEAAKRLKMDEEDRKKMVSRRTIPHTSVQEKVNPLSPNCDQHLTSPYNITG